MRRFVLALASTAVLLSACGKETQQVSQGLPEVKWRLQSSFPKSLDTLYGAGEEIAQRVAAATGGKFQISVFAAGEIVPALQVLDAVQTGTVQAGHTAGYYYYGKDPVFAIGTALPFGMNARQQNAWLYDGGGLELLREFYKGYNVIQFPAGNTGTQMGGWFRKEINSVKDLQGLKVRIAGLGGVVMSRLGAVPQQIGGPDIYPSLEKGAIDAAEWVGPYDDEKLGFYKVAKYYYYPGWWEGGPTLEVQVNLDAWKALPKEYQAAFEAAAAAANVNMLAKYDAKNTQALKRLLAQGVQLRPFPADVMRAAYTEAHKVYEELAAANPNFRKIYDSWREFRDNAIPWSSIADGRFDDFMAAMARESQKK